MNTVRWEYAAADITKFGITQFTIQRKNEVCSGSGAYATVASVGPEARNVQDNGANAPGDYCYRVLAVGPTGTSDPSTPAGISILGAPPAPVNVSVV